MDERIIAALARVFASRGPRSADSLGAAVRPDTPLAALGPIGLAWPLLAAALADVGIVLDAEAARGIVTVGDLDRACA